MIWRTKLVAELPINVRVTRNEGDEFFHATAATSFGEELLVAGEVSRSERKAVAFALISYGEQLLADEAKHREEVDALGVLEQKVHWLKGRLGYVAEAMKKAKLTPEQEAIADQMIGLGKQDEEGNEDG